MDPESPTFSKIFGFHRRLMMMKAEARGSLRVAEHGAMAGAVGERESRSAVGRRVDDGEEDFRVK